VALPAAGSPRAQMHAGIARRGNDEGGAIVPGMVLA
jgi:hypothetical protein